MLLFLPNPTNFTFLTEFFFLFQVARLDNGGKLMKRFRVVQLLLCITSIWGIGPVVNNNLIVSGDVPVQVRRDDRVPWGMLGGVRELVKIVVPILRGGNVVVWATTLF